MDDLVAWLYAVLADDERKAREWQARDIERDTDTSGIAMPGWVKADVAAKRKVVKLYENALAAHRRGSIVERYNVQDEAAVDVLGTAVQELAMPYACRPGYQESWRPA